MGDEKGHNQKKRKQKRIDRLKLLADVDLCSCGSGDKLKCHGICRENHTCPGTDRVECSELYQVGQPEVQRVGSRRPKREWKFGRQKDGDENKRAKQRRGEKWERSGSE